MKRCGLWVVVTGLAAGCASVPSAMPDDGRLLRPTGQAAVPDPAPPRLIAGEPRSAEPAVTQMPEAPQALAKRAAGAEAESVEATTAVAEARQPAGAAGARDADDKVAPAAVGLARVDGQGPGGALSSLDTEPGEPATEVAARVGETIITLRELKHAVRSRLKPGTNWGQLSHEQKNQVGLESLEYLIDRALIIQEARRTLSKPKQWETFKEFADKSWHDNELAEVMKRHGAANEAALRKKLETTGQTLDELRQSYLLDQMTRMYTSEKLREKADEPGLREIYEYYRANLASFELPARTTWREIYFAVDEKTDRASARAKAQAARSRVLGGEDFARVAEAESQSPRAKEGGLWQTSPGGFGSAAVNEALEKLPIGGTSEVIEDAQGFYVVRVEARRGSGPAPFEEVQGKIAEALRGRAFEKAMETYLREVRGRTPVSSPLFDGGESQPMQSAGRRGGRVAG